MTNAKFIDVKLEQAKAGAQRAADRDSNGPATIRFSPANESASRITSMWAFDMLRLNTACGVPSPTPSYQEALDAGAISPNTTESGWHSLTPGMRREIVHAARKKAAAS